MWMTAATNRCFLVRHGETEWSRLGRHTGRTDLPLLEEGRAQARGLQGRIERTNLAGVLVSPLERALETCALAGLDEEAAIDPDLAEWNYGEVEGLTTAEIRLVRPGWDLFEDGAPGGETIDQVIDRADRVIARVRSMGGDVACFSHGHLIRVLAARWAGFAAADGRRLMVDPSSVGILGWDRDRPVIERWNLV